MCAERVCCGNLRCGAILGSCGRFWSQKSHLTCLQKRAKVADRWAALFDRKQYKFSNRFLHTLSMFGLHNMRGSDEGMELIIAGAIKGLVQEVGFSLNNLALSRGCPSRCTLAQGNKRLAVDVLVSVVRDLQRILCPDQRR